MREGTMPEVMQQYSHGYSLRFFICNLYTFLSQDIDGGTHQVHAANGMFKPGMIGSRVYLGGQAQLSNSPETLKIGMFDQIVQQAGIQVYEAPDGIVDNFMLILLQWLLFLYWIEI
jgi:hypothetical protein